MSSGCSAVRLAHLLWEQGVPSSNLGTPTMNDLTAMLSRFFVYFPFQPPPFPAKTDAGCDISPKRQTRLQQQIINNIESATRAISQLLLPLILQLIFKLQSNRLNSQQLKLITNAQPQAFRKQKNVIFSYIIFCRNQQARFPLHRYS